MQHKYGKPFHRSTEWRRLKRFSETGADSQRGRKWASESRDKSFLGFAATVISLINKNGSVGYGEIKSDDGSYWKDETTDSIFDRLATSAFPPAMVAVAACLIGKLNKETRRGALPLHPRPDQRAFNALKKSSAAITTKNYETVLRREKLDLVLRQNQMNKADRQRLLTEAAKGDFKKGWVLGYLKQYQTPATRRLHGLAPVAVTTRGTPAHRMDYANGAEISRRMACHWRKHPLFPDCAKLLLSLLKRERPRTKSDKSFAMTLDAWSAGEISTWMNVRKIEVQRKKVAS